MSKHHAQIYRNLASLNETGIDLRKSLTLSTSKTVGRLKTALYRAAEHVNEGGTIAEGLRLTRGAFSKLDIDMIEAAEKTGELPLTLRAMAEHHENQDKLIRENSRLLLRTFAYIHIAIVAIVCIEIIFGTIEAGGGIPDFSNVSWIVTTRLLFIWVPIISIYLIITKTPQQGPLRTAVDMIFYFIPGLGHALEDLGLSRFLMVCNLSFKAGIPESESIKLACQATGNTAVASMFKDSIEKVKQGHPASDGFSSRLPIQFREVWSIGEMSGTMEDTTSRMSKNYAESGNYKMKGFCSTMTWIIYLCTIIYIAFKIIQFAQVYVGAIGLG